MNNIFSLKLLQFSKKLGSQKKLINLIDAFLALISKESGCSKKSFNINNSCYPLIDDLPFQTLENFKFSRILTFSQQPKVDFKTDPYYFFQEIRNCCFIPLVIESKIIGMLYLENVDDSQDNLKFLNLLCVQSAIYFENVLLLESMEDKMRERALELETSKKDITDLNNLFKKINSMNSFSSVMEKVITYIERRFGFNYYTFGQLSNDRTLGKHLLVKLPLNISDIEIEKLYNTNYNFDRHSIFFKNYVRGNNTNIFHINNKLKLSAHEEYFIDLVGAKTFILAPGSYSEKVFYFFGLYSEFEINLTPEELSIISLLSENLVNLYCSIKTNNEIKASIKLSETAREMAVKAQKETERIHEMISAVIQSIDIDSLFLKLSSVLKKHYNINSFMVYFINEKKNSLIFENIISDLEINSDILLKLKENEIPLNESNCLHAVVVNKKKPIFVPRLFPKDISDSEIVIKNTINLEWIYIVPLIYNGMVFGTLNIGTNIYGQCNPWIFSQIIKEEYENFIYLLTPSIYNSIQKIKIQNAYHELHKSQNELIQKEKFATLGKLVSSIAHEINTPLGAIKGNAENLKLSSIDFAEQDLLFIGTLEPQKLFLIQKIILKIRLRESLTLKEERLKKKEIKNFLNDNNVENANEIADILIDSKIYEVDDDILTILYSENNIKIFNIIKRIAGFYYKIKNIETAIDKTSKIVIALKSYSTLDSDESEFKSFSIKDSIEYVLALYKNNLPDSIQIIKDYDDGAPNMYGNMEELNQVWLNLIFNAMQAMDYDGILKIYLKHVNMGVFVSIVDNGPGIPDEIQSKIFDPFFSTKNNSESIGLGLHACQNIIEKHKGVLNFSSVPGRTEFTVLLKVLREVH